MLQAPVGEGLHDLYTLTREPYECIDFEPPNYFVWNYPTSIFRQHLIAQRPGPQERHILVGREYTILNAAGATSRTVESDEQLRAILAERFGLEAIPDGALPAAQA